MGKGQPDCPAPSEGFSKESKVTSGVQEMNRQAHSVEVVGTKSILPVRVCVFVDIL